MRAYIVVANTRAQTEHEPSKDFAPMIRQIVWASEVHEMACAFRHPEEDWLQALAALAVDYGPLTQNQIRVEYHPRHEYCEISGNRMMYPRNRLFPFVKSIAKLGIELSYSTLDRARAEQEQSLNSV